MTDFVLLTGMMCDERLFTSLVPELSPPSTIHTPDLTGHDDWDNLADDVLSTMPDQAILLGVSFGGALALEICARTRTQTPQSGARAGCNSSMTFNASDCTA